MSAPNAEPQLRQQRLRPLAMADDRPRDFLGRGQPRSLDAALLFRAIPGLSSQFTKRVPDEFWAEDLQDGETVANVSCPCGSTPSAPEAGFVSCACGRVYLYTGARVQVGYGEGFHGPQDDPKVVEPESPVE